MRPSSISLYLKTITELLPLRALYHPFELSMFLSKAVHFSEDILISTLISLTRLTRSQASLFFSTARCSLRIATWLAPDILLQFDDGVVTVR